jgi:excisionase family DNA binding protein
MNLLTIAQAAEMLKVHPNTIRNLIRDGYITPVRLGERVIRINLEELIKGENK